MEFFEGVLIEESLTNPAILARCHIVSTRILPVTDEHQTPWLKQWTLHTVSIPSNIAGELAGDVSRSLDTMHPGSWYADFKSDTHHYVVYPNKVFMINRTDSEQYRRAAEYGISIGIPDHQVDFEDHIKKAI